MSRCWYVYCLNTSATWLRAAGYDVDEFPSCEICTDCTTQTELPMVIIAVIVYLLFIERVFYYRKRR